MRVARLEDHLGYWLRYVSNAVSNAFAAKLAERDVGIAEWVILRELYGNASLAPSFIATRLGMTRGGITKLVDRLETKGLLKRGAARDDRRYQALSLTRSGRALVPQLAELADQNDREFFAQISAADRAIIERTMKELVRNLRLQVTPTD